MVVSVWCTLLVSCRRLPSMCALCAPPSTLIHSHPLSTTRIHSPSTTILNTPLLNSVLLLHPIRFTPPSSSPPRFPPRHPFHTHSPLPTPLPSLPRCRNADVIQEVLIVLYRHYLSSPHGTDTPRTAHRIVQCTGRPTRAHAGTHNSSCSYPRSWARGVCGGDNGGWGL